MSSSSSTLKSRSTCSSVAPDTARRAQLAFASAAWLRRLCALEASPNRVAQHRGHRDAPIPLVLALDDVPGRLVGAGSPNRAIGGGDEPIEHPPVTPRVLADAPPAQRILLERLESLLLRGLAEVHPELQDHRAIIGERALERGDLVQQRVEFRVVDPARDAMADRRRIPALRKSAMRPWGGRSERRTQWARQQHRSNPAGGRCARAGGSPPVRYDAVGPGYLLEHGHPFAGRKMRPRRPRRPAIGEGHRDQRGDGPAVLTPAPIPSGNGCAGADSVVRKSRTGRSWASPGISGRRGHGIRIFGASTVPYAQLPHPDSSSPRFALRTAASPERISTLVRGALPRRTLR